MAELVETLCEIRDCLFGIVLALIGVYLVLLLKNFGGKK